MIRILTLLSFLLIPSTLCASEALDTWDESPRPSGTGAPISVTFGNGMFVAGGRQGAILTSTNGVDWAKQDSTTTLDIHRVKFVNDRFFAFSDQGGGVTLVSANGVKWAALNNVTVKDVTYGNGAYFAVQGSTTGPVGPGGSGVLTSPDLTQWTSVGNVAFDDIGFGGGVFVARTDNPRPNIPILSFSNDAQNWTKTGATTPLTSFDSEITYQNGIFSTFRMGCQGCFPEDFPGDILSFSNNGRSWTNGFGIEGNFTPLKMGAGGSFYVVAAGNSIFYTSNLVAAGTVDSGDAFHTRTFVITNWTRTDFAISNPETGFSDVVFGNARALDASAGIFVAVTFGKIFVSNPVIGTTPLRFVEQPQTQTVNASRTISLSVVVQASDPITYQWRRNGTNLVDARERILTLTNATPELAGEYDVVVTSGRGTATSQKAVVTVLFTSVHFYAGVSLSGNPGDKFLVESQDQLGSGQWQTAAEVTLTNQRSIWFDADSLAHPNRFYRATFVGR
jgi:hypothetical protein